MVNLINIFVKNKNLSYSNLGKARSYSYDGLGNRIGFKEYEKQIGYGEDGLKTILGGDKNAKFNYCDFDYMKKR